MWDEKSDLERWRRERICEQMGFVQVKGIVVSCLRWVFWFLGLLDRFFYRGYIYRSIRGEFSGVGPWLLDDSVVRKVNSYHT